MSDFLSEAWWVLKDLTTESRNGDIAAMLILGALVLAAPAVISLCAPLLVVLAIGWAIGRVFGRKRRDS